MKVKLLLLLIFAFAKANNAQAQVFIDKVNAPMNPEGPYWEKLAARDLKGDVYSVDFKEYSRNGRLAFLQSNTTLNRMMALTRYK